MRLLHLADLHPNNAGTFAGRVATHESGMNQALVDLDRSLEFVLHFAIQRGCQLAVIPGDLFDSPRPHMNEVEVISRFVRRLAEHMRVCLIPGNHDLSQNTEDASALACLQGIPNVHSFTAPATITLADVGAQVSFLPYPTRGRLLAQEGPTVPTPEAITAEVNRLLGVILQGMNAEGQKAGTSQWPRILLAHGSVTGTVAVGEQPRSLAHDIQIPLREVGWADYVALGHIHQHQQVGAKAWYSGSLMRQSFGEEHEAKGFCLVDVEVGIEPSVAFIQNPHARCYRTVSVSDIPDSPLTPAGQATVWRIKDQLTTEAYAAARPAIEAFMRDAAYVQQDIDLVTETRARDAGMVAMATMEAALRRALPDIEDDAWPGVLASHAALVAEEEGR